MRSSRDEAVSPVDCPEAGGEGKVSGQLSWI
jgi:hypothetical protein